MFLSNQYTNEYYKIIESSKLRTKDFSIKQIKKHFGYTEKHHIIPRCLGGLDKQENYVYLSAMDHFRCHKLLVEMTDGENNGKMWNALWRMMNKQSKNQDRDYEFTPEEYETARINHAKAHSLRMSGENNPFYNQKHNEESLSKMSAAKKGKTYEEIFGEEAARVLRAQRSQERSGKVSSKETRQLIRESKLGKARPDLALRNLQNNKELKLQIISQIESTPYYRGMFRAIGKELNCDHELVSRIYKNINMYKQALTNVEVN